MLKPVQQAPEAALVSGLVDMYHIRGNLKKVCILSIVTNCRAMRKAKSYSDGIQTHILLTIRLCPVVIDPGYYLS